MARVRERDTRTKRGVGADKGMDCWALISIFRSKHSWTWMD